MVDGSPNPLSTPASCVCGWKGNTRLTIAIIIVIIAVAGLSFSLGARVGARSKSANDGERAVVDLHSTGQMSVPAQTDQVAPLPIPDKVVAYYFHGSVRCETCLEIERRACDVIFDSFQKAQLEGRLEWSSINYEHPGNEHFADDYNLPYPSLVLVKFRNGRRVEWKILDKTWDLVMDQNAFSEYIREAVTAYLN